METPECDKMLAIVKESQKCGEFLDWLEQEKHWTLCRENIEEQVEAGMASEPPRVSYCPLHYSKEELLAEFFGIDLKKVEQERRALLEEIRNAHKNH